ncbi:MAG: DUF2088 domain-containing protein [Candidatus Hydrogenedentes bacterium]|nr:DUF2088 domain-containing protein [Candidatus Hydrogenedentota bacterium]
MAHLTTAAPAELLEAVAETGTLSGASLAVFVAEALESADIRGERVLFVVPDTTRSMPMAAMFRAFCDAALPVAAQVDVLIALGTHPPMPEDAIRRWFGLSEKERLVTYGKVGIYNHAWDDPASLAEIGVIDAATLEVLSEGRMSMDVPVHINKRVLDYDHVIVVGPVFPHEVVGFSGGNKYFFPGIGGQQILDMFHWLGALITNYSINGTKTTPVRAVVDYAAGMIPIRKSCFCLSIVGVEAQAICYGTPEAAWSRAADRSAGLHIRYVKRPFKKVLAIASEKYDELWVAGKCMYKLEPAVADGGELIIYGKHVKEVSVTHGHLIKKIGYHVRDYFTMQMERFADIPGGILAHSTHVKGMGTYENGVEVPRVEVTLATSIPEAECREINLGYRDPDSIHISEWENREDEGILVVHNAGEILYHVEGM